ncbi:hypothetical protein BU24DRAFT_456040 [Aaosphaeria arxii CBS 175.79]|uniref:Uncharacterized protein n=1 Tax=Aaosphaeria arxii CBS 175.79 TaxID=1450172 RepID=A0A6A5X770_9PLEO|nr:uncharacterized protein BU24DRAFT_456040 [Aaosphaeria arxii CBS 175.79]KAF2008779.1 hypothetical protein BU24DRAFT_456040 [Aaosphaeria arxii CBS 175.79]
MSHDMNPGIMPNPRLRPKVQLLLAIPSAVLTDLGGGFAFVGTLLAAVLTDRGKVGRVKFVCLPCLFSLCLNEKVPGFSHAVWPFVGNSRRVVVCCSPALIPTSRRRNPRAHARLFRGGSAPLDLKKASLKRLVREKHTLKAAKTVAQERRPNQVLSTLRPTHQLSLDQTGYFERGSAYPISFDSELPGRYGGREPTFRHTGTTERHHHRPSQHSISARVSSFSNPDVRTQHNHHRADLSIPNFTELLTRLFSGLSLNSF